MPKWGWGIVSSGYKYFLADISNDYVWAVKSGLSDADLKANIYTLYNISGQYFIAAPSSSQVVVWGQNWASGNYELLSSNDGGVTFPNLYSLGSESPYGNFDSGQLSMDWTVSPGIVWQAGSAGGPGNSCNIRVSIDGGASWIATNLRNVPADKFVVIINVTTRYDGNTAFVHTEFRQNVSPFSWTDGYIDLVDKTGAVIGSYHYTPQLIFNDPPGGPPYYGLWAVGCSKNQPNLFYGCAYNSGLLWQFDWNTTTWTLNTSYVPTQNQRLIYCSRTGTMFILEAPGSIPNFVMNRSNDNGMTWSPVSIPVTGSDTQYLPMSMTVASDNQLAIPYNKRGSMSLMTSDDDGATWTLRPVMPSLDAERGWVSDLSGIL